MPSLTRHNRVDVRSARTAEELLSLAGPDFGFTVEARDAYFQTPDDIEGATGRAAMAQVIVRTDTNEALSVVGSAYVPAQVRDFLAPLDALLRAGSVRAVSAVAFDRGTTRAIELELPKPIILPGPNGTEDVLLRRVIWRDTLDGTARLSLMDSLLRRWCANGATQVIGMAGAMFRHTAAKMLEAANVIDAIEAADARFRLVEANAQMLLATPFTSQQMADVVEELWPADDTGEVSKGALARREKLGGLFAGGQATFGATAWDAVNAVTEYATHHRPVRGSESQLARLKAIWLGGSQTDRGIAAVARHAGITVDAGGAMQR